jgi:hypothetical protein
LSSSVLGGHSLRTAGQASSGTLETASRHFQNTFWE